MYFHQLSKDKQQIRPNSSGTMCYIPIYRRWSMILRLVPPMFSGTGSTAQHAHALAAIIVPQTHFWLSHGIALFPTIYQPTIATRSRCRGNGSLLFSNQPTVFNPIVHPPGNFWHPLRRVCCRCLRYPPVYIIPFLSASPPTVGLSLRAPRGPGHRDRLLANALRSSVVSTSLHSKLFPTPSTSKKPTRFLSLNFDLFTVAIDTDHHFL